MPYRRFRRRRPRRYRKVVSGKRGLIPVSSAYSIRATPRMYKTVASSIPNKIFVKLRYATTYAYSNAGGALVDRVFRGNGMFDPDETGAGHQPLGFDQFAAFYGRYRVTASRFRVTINNDSEDVNNGLRFVIFASRTDTGLTYEEAAEQPGARYAIAGQGGRVRTLAKYCKTKMIYPDLYKSKDLAAAVGSDPTNNWKWRVIMEGTNAAQTDAQLNVLIVYYAEFSSPVVLTSS